MIQFEAIRPLIWTQSFEETLSFYTDILGFIVAERNDSWNWACLERENVQIMVALPNKNHPTLEIGFSGSFYITVSDVDQLWEKIHAQTKICYDIENFEWGMREFAIYDNNGYLLQFGQSI